MTQKIVINIVLRKRVSLRGPSRIASNSSNPIKLRSPKNVMKWVNALLAIDLNVFFNKYFANLLSATTFCSKIKAEDCRSSAPFSDLWSRRSTQLLGQRRKRFHKSNVMNRKNLIWALKIFWFFPLNSISWWSNKRVNWSNIQNV